MPNAEPPANTPEHPDPTGGLPRQMEAKAEATAMGDVDLENARETNDLGPLELKERDLDDDRELPLTDAEAEVMGLERGDDGNWVIPKPAKKK